MTWRLTRWARTRQPLTGVPWRDLTDEEFATAEARFQPGALRGRYFEQDPPPPAEVPRRRPQARVSEEPPVVVDEPESAAPELPAEEEQTDGS